MALHSLLHRFGGSSNALWFKVHISEALRPWMSGIGPACQMGSCCLAPASSGTLGGLVKPLPPRGLSPIEVSPPEWSSYDRERTVPRQGTCIFMMVGMSQCVGIPGLGCTKPCSRRLPLWWNGPRKAYSCRLTLCWLPVIELVPPGLSVWGISQEFCVLVPTAPDTAEECLLQPDLSIKGALPFLLCTGVLFE